MQRTAMVRPYTKGEDKTLTHFGVVAGGPIGFMGKVGSQFGSPKLWRRVFFGQFKSL